MPNSHELKREIDRLQGKLKEQIQIEDLTKQKINLERDLKIQEGKTNKVLEEYKNPPKPQKQSGFRKFLGVVARAETNRAKMPNAQLKKPYKAITFDSIGFKV